MDPHSDCVMALSNFCAIDVNPLNSVGYSLLYAHHVSGSNCYESRFAGISLGGGIKRRTIQKLMEDSAFNPRST
jgi:hypothetical protein